jgi:hypothetical protein
LHACVAKLVTATALEAVILADLRVRAPPQAILILLLGRRLVHEALTLTCSNRSNSPISIIQLPVVVPELVLAEVAVQMLFVAMFSRIAPCKVFAVTFAIGLAWRLPGIRPGKSVNPVPGFSTAHPCA